MRAKSAELFKIRGARVSECFIDPILGDGGVVVIFFSLVFTYENAGKEIFITETKSEVTTDEIALTSRLKSYLLKAMRGKFDLFLDRIKPYL